MKMRKSLVGLVVGLLLAFVSIVHAGQPEALQAKSDCQDWKTMAGEDIGSGYEDLNTVELLRYEIDHLKICENCEPLWNSADWHIDGGKELLYVGPGDTAVSENNKGDTYWGQAMDHMQALQWDDAVSDFGSAAGWYESSTFFSSDACDEFGEANEHLSDIITCGCYETEGEGEE